MAAERAVAVPSRLPFLARLTASVLSGAIAAAAMPPWAHWWAMVLGFSAFALLLNGLPSISSRRAFGLGWAFGFGYFGVSLAWIGQAFFVDPETYAWMMPFAVTGLPALLAVYWGIAALAAGWIKAGVPRTLALVLALAVVEYGRAQLLTGFPWNAPGYAVSSLAGMPQAAAVMGLYGLTLLVLLWSATPALAFEAWRSRSSKQAILPVLLILTALGVEAAGRARLAEAGDGVVDGVRVRIVQPAVPQTLKWDEAEARRIFALLLAMTRGEAPGAGKETPTLVVWPESAVPFLLEESPDGLAQLADAAPAGAHLLIGALRRTVEADPATGQRKVFNSILTIGPGAAVLNRYDKWQLVPFGEYLPLEAILEPLGLRRIVQVPGGLSAGPGPRTVSIDGVPAFVPLVCYEGIFPEAVQPEGERASFLLNVTNDAWFGDSAGPHQHLEQARMRAIEQGLPLIRAANTGISAVVDAYGRVRAEAALGTRTVIDTPLPIVAGVTTYARYHQTVFMLLGIAMIAVVTLYSRR